MDINLAKNISLSLGREEDVFLKQAAGYLKILSEVKINNNKHVKE